MQIFAQKIWETAQEQLRSRLNADTYKLWFAHLRAHAQGDNGLVLEVADDFCEVWIKDNYTGLLQEVVALAAGRKLEIQFKVGANGAGALQAPPGAPSAKATVPQPPSERSNNLRPESGFNPNNTFETFVVGDNNSFAHAAAMAVAQAPGKSYNPLFLYGGVGLGKTHLLHAIGHHVARHTRETRVAYVSCEQFTNDYIDGIQNNQLAKFRKKYRQTDVLLIDDVQFLAGKEGIQEEFFHTFNALHEARKQIVLTCDRPAAELQNLEQRLVSRFEWGLVTDLQLPDVEVRLAILRKKAQLGGMELPEEIMSFLANRIRSNIRRLEGALIRVASYTALTGQKLSLDLVESLLREILHEEGRHTMTIEVIQKKVAEHFDIRLADMSSKRRPENIAFPRQIAMFLSRQMTEGSLSAIGEAFGGRDHGTVLHACRLVKDRMEVDARVRGVVGHLEMQLAR
ncbi:MAG TPA: chromosomal replication initiator protein DnaA [Candidatus Acidoferrum sp.]|jgi:chromosomal replication initiator protein|nr:chromosomal replication initiator protein DnaA [Candidatus Acidoferrum sp.]